MCLRTYISLSQWTQVQLTEENDISNRQLWMYQIPVLCIPRQIPVRYRRVPSKPLSPRARSGVYMTQSQKYNRTRGPLNIQVVTNFSWTDRKSTEICRRMVVMVDQVIKRQDNQTGIRGLSEDRCFDNKSPYRGRESIRNDSNTENVNLYVVNVSSHFNRTLVLVLLLD